MHEGFAPARRFRGFTIMELLVVISCIGILTAFAYPRFAMVETEARKALVTSLGGSVGSAAMQAHILWIVQGEPATIDMEGQAITMLNGYPDESSIDNTLMDYSGFQFNPNPVARFRHNTAPQKSFCKVEYEEAAAGSRPAITVDTSGC